MEIFKNIYPQADRLRFLTFAIPLPYGLRQLGSEEYVVCIKRVKGKISHEVQYIFSSKIIFFNLQYLLLTFTFEKKSLQVRKKAKKKICLCPRPKVFAQKYLIPKYKYFQKCISAVKINFAFSYFYQTCIWYRLRQWATILNCADFMVRKYYRLFGAGSDLVQRCQKHNEWV